MDVYINTNAQKGEQIMSFFTPWTGTSRNRATDIFDIFDRTFNDVGFFVQPTGTSRANLNTNVTQDDNQYRVQMSVPGVPKDEINLNVNNNIMTVSYDSREVSENTFATRSFQKSWTLPDNSDLERITANSTDGILTISIPKEVTTDLPERTITIQ